MLNFKELKKQVIIKREKENILYYNEDDIKFWKSNTSEIYGIKNKNLIFILDNTGDLYTKKLRYKVKVYDIKNGKINTLYDTQNKILAENIIKILAIYNFSEVKIEILMTGEINFQDKEKLTVKSLYLKKQFEIFDLLKYLEV